MARLSMGMTGRMGVRRPGRVRAGPAVLFALFNRIDIYMELTKATSTLPRPLRRLVEDAELGAEDGVAHVEVLADLGAVESLEARVPDHDLDGVEVGDQLDGGREQLDDAAAGGQAG